MVKNCDPCCQIKDSLTKAPIHNWETPSENFQRVHMNYAVPFLGHQFFIIVDAKSKWSEVIMQKTPPITESTIHHLRKVLSRYRLLEILVSDNGLFLK